MYGESDNQHYHNTAQGLIHLSEFLNNRFMQAPLNVASRVEVNYSILQSDPEDARQEFAEWSKYLRECDGSYWGAKFVETRRVYADNPTTHHVAELQFADNHVAYRVVWIERKAQADEQY